MNFSLLLLVMANTFLELLNFGGILSHLKFISHVKTNISGHLKYSCVPAVAISKHGHKFFISHLEVELYVPSF